MLAADLDAVASGARAVVEGRTLPLDAVRVLEDVPGFCVRYVPGSWLAESRLGVIPRRERTPLYRTRMVRGPVPILAIVPDGAAGLTLARGAAVVVETHTSESRLEPHDLLGHPLASPPAWARVLDDEDR
jgi:hypothetical protein